MGATVNIDFGEFELGIIEETQRIGKEAQAEVKKNTPEKSGRLEENIDISSVKTNSDGAEIEVFVDLDKVAYAGYVEDGVGGRDYNYHKPAGTPFKSGVGAKMFQDTALLFEKTRGNL